MKKANAKIGQSESAGVKAIAPTSAGHRVLGARPVGWFVFVQGNKLRGNLIGRFERMVGPSLFERTDVPRSVSFYQVELLEPAQVREASGGIVEASTGSVVNLDETSALRVFRERALEVLRGAQYEICVVCNGKRSIAGGKSIHDLVLTGMMVRPPLPDADELRVEDLILRIQAESEVVAETQRDLLKLKRAKGLGKGARQSVDAAVGRLSDLQKKLDTEWEALEQTSEEWAVHSEASACLRAARTAKARGKDREAGRLEKLAAEMLGPKDGRCSH